MDKEDCIQVLLSTLQRPPWNSSNSVTDWDLKDILWRAGLLLTPEQEAGLLADIKRRGLISGRERRIENQIHSLWGIHITAQGEEWLAQRVAGLQRVSKPASVDRPPEPPSEPQPSQQQEDPADGPAEPDIPPE